MIDFIHLDKERPVSMGFAALREAERETGQNVSQIMASLATISVTDAVYVCYLGLKHGARQKGEGFDLDIDQVADLLDQPGKMEELSALIGEQLGKLFAPGLMQETPPAQ